LTGLPALTATEVIKLIRPILTARLADEVNSEMGFVLWRDRPGDDLVEGGASFEISFRTSKDAFHTRRLAEYHYVRHDNGTRYSIEAVRKHCSIGDPEEDGDANDLREMAQPGKDIAEKDVLNGDEGQVIGWRLRGPNLLEAASPVARRKRGKGKFKMLSAESESRNDDGITDSEAEEEDLQICEQCCDIVDEERLPAYNHKWIRSEEEG
jgi:hypothetical protein